MEVERNLRSSLKGTLNRKQRTIIHFDYGGQYVKKGEKILWITGKDVHHALLIRQSVEEVTYDILVESIRKKMGENEEKSEMKLSYFPVGVDPKWPIYIFNDDDVVCYLEPCEGKMKGVLHVETKTNDPREDRVSQVNASNKDMVSTSRVNCGVNYGSITISASEVSEKYATVAHEVECENLENIEVRDTRLAEFDNVHMRDTHVVEGDEIHNVEWEDGMNVKLSQEFGSKEDVKELVEKASFVNCFRFDIVKSDKTRYVVKCCESINGCKWSLRAARIKDSDIFSVRTYNKIHTCSRVSSTSLVKRRKGTPQLVASVVQDHYPGKLDTPTLKSLIGMVQGKYGVKVSYLTAYRGKKQASADVQGSPEESYKMLYSYLYMLQIMNPGTVSYVEVDDDQKFKYLFFALVACMEGFQVMRKVIIVDGTHLKNAYSGVLLVATAQDPNHHHYLIAFGVVDGERDGSCAWFFNKLKTLIPDVPGLVFISDKTIREVYSLSHHGYCVFHLSQNVKMHASNVNKEKVAVKFRELAHAYTQAEFETLYDDFKKRYPSAAEYVERSIEPNKWARFFFPSERYNIDTTNCAESLNAIFKEARKYSLLPMIDAIIEKIAKWFNKHRQTSTEAHKLVSFIENMSHESCVAAQHLAVTLLNNYYLQFNVIGRDGRGYFVDLRMKTCTCKHYYIDKYPCVHAIATFMEARKKEYTHLEVEDLCSKFYAMEQWAFAYYKTIFLVPHMSQWNVPDNVRAMCVHPPDYVKKKRKPQITRFPSVGEHRQRRKKTSLYEWFECSTSENT